MKKKQQP